MPKGQNVADVCGIIQGTLTNMAAMPGDKLQICVIQEAFRYFVLSHTEIKPD